jgi:hypothetical protein
MSKNQMKFDFQSLKVGDLVAENNRFANEYKKYGVIVEIDKGKYLDQVKVHWMNYGSFWTLSDKLTKINKHEEI